MRNQLSHNNYVWVDTDAGVLEMLEVLLQQPCVAVDTESDSLYSYFEKVCLLQFSVPGTDYLVDSLAADVAPLGELFASPDVQKIFHAAEYDILSLKRDYRFEFDHLFDTMIAARVLGWPRYGLGSIMKEYFNLNLDKRFQRYDWGRRPLDPDALAYARLDTHYLHALREKQLEQLARQNRLREASEAFARLTQLEPTERNFDPADFWRIKRARHLPPPAQGVLQALYIFRDRQARRLNCPPFKILTDSTLVRLAEEQPRTLAALARIKGISALQVRRIGQEIVSTIRCALQAPPPAAPRNHTPRPADDVLRRYEQLRQWRNQAANQRGVEPDVILPNSTLMTIAEKGPSSPAELRALDILGAWQFETYAQTILQILNGGSGRGRA